MNKNFKKILIFSLAYPPFVGGAEVAIGEITNRIQDIQFDMITLRFDKNLPKFEKIGNVNVYRIGFTIKDPQMGDLLKFPLKINKLLFPFMAYFKAAKLHKKNKYDAVWAMMAAYAGFAAMFFKTANPKVPYLLTLQEGDPIDYILKKVRLVRPLFNRIFTKADYIQTISTYLADWASSMNYQGKIRVVPNAVDTAYFSQKYPDQDLEELKKKLEKKASEKFVITTSRLVLKNAIDDVIKSLKYLPVEIKFLILGSGPDEAMLKELAAGEKLGDRVIFLGQVDYSDLPRYLKISDIFIRPSLSEGFGNSFIEAMASELPVIATPVGGITDFLFDPEKNPDQPSTGFFCEVRSPKSIAEQINKCLKNNELRGQIISNAKKMVFEKYDWNLISRQMREIFFEL